MEFILFLLGWTIWEAVKYWWRLRQNQSETGYRLHFSATVRQFEDSNDFLEYLLEFRTKDNGLMLEDVIYKVYEPRREDS